MIENQFKLCQWHGGGYHSTEIYRLTDIVHIVHDARYWLERVFSMKRIVDVAKRVHLHEYIQKQPEQYDTILDSRYLCLSIGQKQRLSIARSILKKPQVYLFDEITSNLDSIYVIENGVVLFRRGVMEYHDVVF